MSVAPVKPWEVSSGNSASPLIPSNSSTLGTSYSNSSVLGNSYNSPSYSRSNYGSSYGGSMYGRSSYGGYGSYGSSYGGYGRSRYGSSYGGYGSYGSSYGRRGYGSSYGGYGGGYGLEPSSPGEEPFVKPGSWMEKGFQKIDSVLYVTDGFARFSELLSINSEAINEAFFSLLDLISGAKEMGFIISNLLLFRVIRKLFNTYVYVFFARGDKKRNDAKKEKEAKEKDAKTKESTTTTTTATTATTTTSTSTNTNGTISKTLPLVKSSSIKYSLSSSKPIESKEAAGTKNPSPSSNLSYSNPLTTQLLSNSAVKNPSPLSNSSVYKKEKLEEGFLTASASQTSLSNSKIVNPTYDANKEIGIDEKDTKNVVVQSVTDNLEKATSSTTST